MSLPSPRAVAPPPCLLPGIKDLLKKDARLLAFGFWLLEEGRLFNVGGFGREKDAEGKMNG
jgi:hypothetical protein